MISAQLEGHETSFRSGTGQLIPELAFVQRDDDAAGGLGGHRHKVPMQPELVGWWAWY